MPSCCSCNGRNAVCRRCVCVRVGRPCTSCLPMKFSKCVNLLSSRAASQSVLPAGRPVPSGGSMASDSSAHVSSLSDEAPRFDSCVDLSDNDSACAKTLIETAGEQLDIDPTIDGLMRQAYGEPLLFSAGPPSRSPWHSRWATVVHHAGRHYSLPSGSVGRQYIDLLNQELQYFVSGLYTAERVIVFGSLMLQRDRLVRKGCDIRRLLERRLSMWCDQQFDVLLQEAIRCDQSLRNTHRSSAKNKTDHVIRVFTKLMLEGNVRAAVRWVTERAGGGLLQPTDSVEYNHPQLGVISKTVLDVLRLKHPDPSIPPASILPSFDNLPYLEDVEVTGAHIQSVACHLQGGAGPGGCDASHWRDVLLRFGSSSARLRDTVAAVCRRLCNTITPWEDICALVACRLSSS